MKTVVDGCVVALVVLGALVVPAAAQRQFGRPQLITSTAE